MSAWEAEKALYHVLDPELKKECTPLYDEIVLGLDQIGKDQTSMYFKGYEIDLKQTTYLSDKTWKMLDQFNKALYEHGYKILEVGTGKPFYQKKGHL